MFAGVVFLLSLFVAVVHGVNSAADLVGTWTTKSRSVVTGPVCCFCNRYQLDGQGDADWVRDSLIQSMTG